MLPSEHRAIFYISLLAFLVWISYLFTKKSAMSWGWALFFSIFFTPIVAVFFTFSIGKYGYSKKRVNSDIGQITKSILCIILAIFSFEMAHKYWQYPFIEHEMGITEYSYLLFYTVRLGECCKYIFWGIGFLGNALYLLLNVDTYQYD